MVSLQVAVTYSPASVSVENQKPSLGQEVMKHLRCLIWVKICQRENQSGLVFLFSPTLPSLLMSSCQYHGALGDNACLPPPDVGQECFPVPDLSTLLLSPGLDGCVIALF